MHQQGHCGHARAGGVVLGRSKPFKLLAFGPGNKANFLANRPSVKSYAIDNFGNGDPLRATGGAKTPALCDTRSTYYEPSKK